MTATGRGTARPVACVAVGNTAAAPQGATRPEGGTRMRLAPRIVLAWALAASALTSVPRGVHAQEVVWRGTVTFTEQATWDIIPPTTQTSPGGSSTTTRASTTSNNSVVITVAEG